jgi:broad specificity phosphatase PhoE
MTGTPDMSVATSRYLVLVHHSIPEVVPGVPARAWPLSSAGRARAARLAERLAVYHPAFVASSGEPKAVATADIVAHRLTVPVEVVAGLHEHARSRAPFMDRDRFEAAVARFFAAPAELILGDETAAQARQRFTRAVSEVIALRGAEDILIVTHGTVMTLFIAAATGIDPFPFWRELGMPCFVALSLPDFRILGRGEVSDAP